MVMAISFLVKVQIWRQGAPWHRPPGQVSRTRAGVLPYVNSKLLDSKS